MRLGFQSKSPFEQIEHYEYGDNNWRVRIKPLGGGDARYSNLHASAFFGHSAKRGEVLARDYIDHPGDIAIFARIHLALTEPPAERLTLDSAQVKALIEQVPPAEDGKLF